MEIPDDGPGSIRRDIEIFCHIAREALVEGVSEALETVMVMMLRVTMVMMVVVVTLVTIMTMVIPWRKGGGKC